MKTVIWVVILFAIAVGLALLGAQYHGLVIIKAGATELRTSLNFFILCTLLFVTALYILERMFFGMLRIPGRIRLHRLNRSRQALHQSALSFLEGRFQKSLDQAQKALKWENDSKNKALALTLSSLSAAKTGNTEEQDKALTQMKQLPHKLQLTRLLLETEQNINAGQLDAARSLLDEANQLAPNLPEVLKLDLKLSASQRQPDKVLTLLGKLGKANMIENEEATDYRLEAYREQLAYLNTEKEIRKWTKKIDSAMLENNLAADVAWKLQQLGANVAAVDWVTQFYPKTHDKNLLAILDNCVMALDNSAQQKLLEQGELWLKNYPNDAHLLLSLGKIAYANKLWGKAQSYLEASIAIEPSFNAYFTLTELFNETDKKDLAREQGQKALALAEKISHEQ